MNGATHPLRSLLRRVMSQRLDPVPARFEARLPSEIPEAQFHVVIEARWPPGMDADQSMRSLAERLLHVARESAKPYSVLDRHEAWAAIERELLGDADVQGSGLVTLVVTDVLVHPDDENLAERQEALRREAALTEAEAENLKVLLADPTTARLWWLENKPDKLAKLVEPEMDATFEKIATRFGGSASRPAADPIAELIRLFLQGLDGRSREHLIDRLRYVFTCYERPDLAGRLDSYQQARASTGYDATARDVDGHSPDPGRV